MDLRSLRDEIKRRVNIVDLINQTTELKKVGNVYVGICPFPHGRKNGQPVYDTKPSLTVYPDQQTYYCYGCGAGDGISVNGGASDIFGWIQNLHGVDFKTALLFLADYAGIKVDARYPAGADKDIISALEAVTRQDERYRENLLSNKTVMDYLAKRGITEELIHHGRLGYLPECNNKLLSNRLTFGISELPLDDGRILTAGMAYRSLDGSLPKYVNDKTTAHFSKRRLLYLFAQNLPAIKETRKAVLVEGYFDALLLYKHGIRNVCSSMSTMLTAEQASLISRYAKEVVIWFDGDYAGQQATLKGISTLQSAGLKVYVLTVPGLDPDVFAESYDGDLSAFIDAQSIAAMDWVVQYVVREYTAANEIKLHILNTVGPVLESLKDANELDVYRHKILSIIGIK